MPDAFSLSKSVPTEPRVVTTLFSLMDWTWRLVAVACTAAAIIADTQIEASISEGTYVGISVGPFGVLSTLLVIVVAGMQLAGHRSATRKLREALKGRPQFIAFDQAGFRYGWEDVVLNSWSWETIALAKLCEDVLILRVGRHRIKVNLDSFEKHEIKALRAELGRRALLPVDGAA